MKKFPRLLASLALVTICALAAAEDGPDRVPDDQARMTATRVRDAVARAFPTPIVKVDARVDQAFGYRSGPAAVLMVPDRGLTARAIKSAGEKVVPVGWLILNGVAPVVAGRPLPSSKLAQVETGAGEKAALLFVGARKEGEKPVLEVYSRDSQPICQVPLVAREAKEGKPRPLAGHFANLDVQSFQADFVTSVEGAYDASLRLGFALE